MNESKKRSILKALTYRTICIVSLVIITYIITRDLVQTSVINVAFHTIQSVLYYLHERAWSRYGPCA